MSEKTDPSVKHELLTRLASLPGTSVTRRSFLKKAASAGAVVYISPTLSTVFAKPAYASITGSPNPTPTATVAPPHPPPPKEKPMYVQYDFFWTIGPGTYSAAPPPETVPVGKILVLEFVHMSVPSHEGLEYSAYIGHSSGAVWLGEFTKMVNGSKAVYSNRDLLFVFGEGDTIFPRISRSNNPAFGVNLTAFMSGLLLPA